ncbi:MAG: BBP7 family outer membrane beta-barrel protein [Thermoguttaceae bacterium]
MFSLALSLALCRATVAEDMAAAAGDAKSPGPQPAASSCPSCQQCCECCCNDYCDPVWTVRADALFLNRSRLPDQTLLVNGLVAPLFNANQFDLPVQMGWQIDLTRRLNCNWDLEARYFDLGGQSATPPTISSPFGTGVIFAPGTPGIAQGIFNPPVNTNLAYTSRLQNVEINACRSLNGRLSLLAGVRYLNLDDRIQVNELTTVGGIDATQQLAGFNDLVGFQIGADAIVVRRGRFSVDTLLKAGVYDDLARNAFTYDSTVFGAHVATGASASNVAFCGEIGITLTYDLTERLSIRGGYQLLWLDGVALASQQPAVNPLPVFSPATTVATTGDVFYNGAFMGLEYHW